MTTITTTTMTAPPHPPKECYIKAKDDDSGLGLYCTKCLVWRKQPGGIRYFHCTICQRCFAHHDHHCGVFGRCIAGRRWRRRRRSWLIFEGNRIFFETLLVTGVLACLSTFAAFLYALSIRYGAKWAIPIGLVTMVLLMSCCCCFNNGPVMRILCWPCCRFIAAIIKLINY